MPSYCFGRCLCWGRGSNPQGITLYSHLPPPSVGASMPILPPQPFLCSSLRRLCEAVRFPSSAVLLVPPTFDVHTLVNQHRHNLAKINRVPYLIACVGCQHLASFKGCSYECFRCVKICSHIALVLVLCALLPRC